jgi:hypothetical protein
MKIKHKRLAIIGCFITWGIISLIIPLCGFALCDQSGELNILGIVCFCSCYIVIKLFKGLQEYPDFNEFIILIIAQFIIYWVLSWMIARLVYPGKKSLAKEEQED